MSGAVATGYSPRMDVRERLLPRDVLIKTSDLDQGDWTYRDGPLGWGSRTRFQMVLRLLRQLNDDPAEGDPRAGLRVGPVPAGARRLRDGRRRRGEPAAGARRGTATGRQFCRRGGGGEHAGVPRRRGRRGVRDRARAAPGRALHRGHARALAVDRLGLHPTDRARPRGDVSGTPRHRPPCPAPTPAAGGAGRLPPGHPRVGVPALLVRGVPHNLRRRLTPRRRGSAPRLRPPRARG